MATRGEQPISKEPTVLEPIREEIVDFYGDQVLAVQAPDATVYVPVRPLCDLLGLAWSGQFERLRSNPVLNPELRFVRVTRTNSPGGDPQVLCLPLKLLPGWLFGVQVSRVRAELREKILRYQRDCYEVLWQAFKGEIQAPATPPGGLTTAEQALLALEAATALARQQVEYERQFTVMRDYMRGHVRQTNAALRDHESRLSALELHVGPAAVVEEAQAAQIAHRVKDIALALGAKDGANHYAAVYDALYRAFDVTSYKTMPRARFAEALAWLDAWWARETT